MPRQGLQLRQAGRAAADQGVHVWRGANSRQQGGTGALHKLVHPRCPLQQLVGLQQKGSSSPRGMPAQQQTLQAGVCMVQCTKRHAPHKPLCYLQASIAAGAGFQEQPGSGNP